MWCNKMCYEFDPIYHDAFNHICKFQSNCFWTLPFWQLMTSLQSYQSVTKHTKNVDVQIMYVHCTSMKNVLSLHKVHTKYEQFLQFYNFLSLPIWSKFYNDDRSGKASLCTHILQEKVCNEWGDNTTRKRSHCCHLYISWWREYYITDRLTHLVCLVPCHLDSMHVKNTSSI